MWVDVPRVSLDDDDRLAIGAWLLGISPDDPSARMASPSQCRAFLSRFGVAGVTEIRVRSNCSEAQLAEVIHLPMRAGRLDGDAA